MAAPLEYLTTELDPFESKPFCALDSLVLSQFCIVNAKHVVPPFVPPSAHDGESTSGHDDESVSAHADGPVQFKDMLQPQHYASMFNDYSPDLVRSVLLGLADSPRFQNFLVTDYLNLVDSSQHVAMQKPIQFAAFTLVCKDQFIYLGFRGTDTTIQGWKESFGLAYEHPAPAQEQALNYLNAVAAKYPHHRIILGGHSKGGNLALYSALHTNREIQDRISHIFSFDAPGFLPETIDEESYERIKGRIQKFIPQESLIGLLLYPQIEFQVIKSNAKGFAQHDTFTWEVNNGDFVYLDSMSKNSLFLQRMLHTWLATLSEGELQSITHALFEAIQAGGAESALDLEITGPGQALTLLREAYKNTQGESKRVLRQAFKSLSKAAVMTLRKNESTLSDTHPS